MAHTLRIILVMGVVAASAVSCTGKRASSGCRAGTVGVAVAPALAGPVTAAAKRFNAQHECGKVAVTARNPAEIANHLAQPGGVSGAARPDAWIPDSSLWGAQARATKAGAASVGASGTSVAMTPLVLAASKQTAAALHSRLTWRSMVLARLPGASHAGPATPAIRFLDPGATAAGLGALLLVHRAAGAGQDGLGRFAITLYSDLQATVPTENDAAVMMTGRSTPNTAFVLPEQTVRAQIERGRPLTILNPGEPTFDLDYPYVLTTSDPAKQKTAAAFGATLTDPETRAAVKALGFRPPRPLNEPGDKALEVLQMWQRTVLGARMLITLDVSPSMGLIVPGTTATRIEATSQVATEGLKLFSDNSEIGLWEFATNLAGARDYREVDPIEPLTARTGDTSQRDRLLASFAAARPVQGTRTGLYNTILAGFKAITAGYQPDRNNILVVLTDGWDDDPGHTMTLHELITALRKAADPNRPVAVVPIAFGPDVRAGPLQEIAKATGGLAFVTMDPAQIRQVFLQVLIHVTCGRSCPLS